MDDIFVLDSTEKYNDLYGLETRHPLVSVINLNEATREPGNIHFRYGLYAVYLKMVKSCDILYGRQPYDYQDGTIVCFAPGQSAQFIMTDDKPQKNVYGLLFHPDIIKGTPLGKEIRRYSFFSYSSNEALHISDEEKKTFMESLGIINRELEHAIDKLCLSANYFGDMVKKETGKTPQEFIQDKIIDLAKEKILGTEDTVSQIAYSLGFQYPQHLCRLFKQKVGCSPNKYRKGNAD